MNATLKTEFARIGEVLEILRGELLALRSQNADLDDDTVESGVSFAKEHAAELAHADVFSRWNELRSQIADEEDADDL